MRTAGDSAVTHCGIGGGPLDNTPTFGGRGGAFLWMLGETTGEMGEVFRRPSLSKCWVGG